MRPLVRQITDEFFRWLSLPNYDTVEVIAATVIANRLPGEPLWLAVVGPSSSGKTEIVRALDGMKRIHHIDKISPTTWASGYKPGAKPTDEEVRPNGGGGPQTPAPYGLLARMMDGEPHIVVMEDFSTVLNARKDIKGTVFSDLRKLYDGKFYVPYGNGMVLNWSGKCGMIVCSTGQYDQQVSDLAAFGERFCVWRSESGEPVAVAERSGRNSEKSKEMREALATAMARLDNLRLPTSDVPLSLDARTLVSRLTAFVALSRTPIPRDPYKRDIITIPEPEGTGRLSAQLHQLLRGLVVLYDHKEVTDREVALVQTCGFSTIPALRRKVMETIDLQRGSTWIELLDRTRIPQTVLRRVLEEMKLLNLIENVGVRRAFAWSPVAEWKPFFHYLTAKQKETANDDETTR